MRPVMTELTQGLAKARDGKASEAAALALTLSGKRCRTKKDAVRAIENMIALIEYHDGLRRVRGGRSAA